MCDLYVHTAHRTPHAAHRRARARARAMAVRSLPLCPSPAHSKRPPRGARQPRATMQLGQSPPHSLVPVPPYPSTVPPLSQRARLSAPLPFRPNTRANPTHCATGTRVGSVL